MADCCTGLATIEKACGGGNTPGLKTKIYVACVDEVATIPAVDASSLIVSTDITMRAADAGPPAIAAGTFKEWSISKINGTWTVEAVGEGENISYNVTVNAFINKISASKSYILNSATGGEFIVIAEDKNGQKRLVGDIDDGCSIKVGEQTNDANGYPVVIEWTVNHLPYFYTGSITT